MAMDPPSLKATAKPPLITPSASPPPTDGPRLASHPPRMPDSVPPAKRQRLLSTPRRTFQDAPSSSSSRPQTPIDIEKEREASKLRLLDVWASLAERYTRRLDEDDIVDIRTGEITRDNGVLRNSRKFDFGDLATPSGPDDEESEPEEQEDEYDLDELDAFADAASEPYDVDDQDDSELKAGGIALPPVTPLNPMDAEDLREFLAAERQRREICGSDLGEEEEAFSLARLDVDAEVEAEDIMQELGDDEEISSGTEPQDEEGKDDAQGDQQGDAHPTELLDHHASRGGTSEDELDNWGIGEESAIRPVLKDDTDSGDSDIEIIEPPVLRTPRPPRTLTSYFAVPKEVETRPTPRKVLQQLHTPPRSQSSTNLSATPSEERFIDLSLDSPPASTSSATSGMPHRSSAPAKDLHKKSNAKPIAESSTSQVAKNILETPTRKLDLTQLSKVNPTRSSPLKTSFSYSESQESASNVRKDATAHPRKLIPFILLTPRKPNNLAMTSSATRASRSSHNGADSADDDDDKRDRAAQKSMSPQKYGRPKKHLDSSSKPRRSTSKDPPLKGKRGSKSRASSPSEESDDPINLPSSSPSSSKHSVRYAEDDRSISASMSKPTRSRQTVELRQTDSPVSRKRKRTVSDMQMQSPEHSKEDRRLHPRDAQSQTSSARSVEDAGARTPVSTKRSSSRKRHSTGKSEPGSGSENGSDSCSTEERRRHRKSSRSRPRNSGAAPHYPYPSGRYLHAHHPEHPQYAPIPDPRAQFIITQAMQQLSALVGSPWPPPHQYGNGTIPHTPSHRNKGHRASSVAYTTPTHHPHPYPYVYDPNFSHATMPPESESSESESSSEPPSSGRRKSLVKRSRSRGRRVSFMADEEGRGPIDVPSSPLGKRPPKGSLRTALASDERQPKPTKRKAEVKAETGEDEYDSESDGGSDSDTHTRGRSYVRGQTPGPSKGGSQKRERG